MATKRQSGRFSAREFRQVRKGARGRGGVGFEAMEPRVLLSSVDYSFAVLASFQTTVDSINGAGPYSLAVDAAGNVYGTQPTGQADNAGSIFKVAANTGTVQTLATFGATTTGLFPQGNLVVDGTGNLYGVSVNGGAFAQGVVWKLPAGSGTMQVLASFNGTNGRGPAGGLVRDAAGNLFGTTTYGGAEDRGTVWELPAGSGTIQTLVSLTQSTGDHPAGWVTLDGQGNLYGTTQNDGPAGSGTVFKVAAGTGAYSILAAFNGGNGAQPVGRLVMDRQGNIFGTTTHGGSQGRGEVFEIPAATGQLVVLDSFNRSNGSNPLGNLVMDPQGNLFGVTSFGGANDRGTVFEVAAGSPRIVPLVSLNDASGRQPTGALVMDGFGNLYGGTTGGGGFDEGTLFKLTATAGQTLFDNAYYLAKYPDVAAAVAAGQFVNGWQHFQAFGEREGRNPSAYFETNYYLAQNADVAGAVAAGTISTAFEHFWRYGQREGRAASPYYLEAYYLQQNPDVAAAVATGEFRSGLEHFMERGRQEERNPSPYFNQTFVLGTSTQIAGLVSQGRYASAIDAYLSPAVSSPRPNPFDLFDESFYLSQNADVAAGVSAGTFISGWDHFVRYGVREQRAVSTRFDEADYLAKNPDVAAAVAAGRFESGLEHYLWFGRAEGRAV